MKYYKYTHYLYLIIAVMFLYDGIKSLYLGSKTPWSSFIFVTLAIFMFFFRLRHIKKLEDDNKEKKD